MKSPFAKKGTGLAIEFSAPKALGKDDSKAEGSSDDVGSSVFGEFADDAFDAIKSGDKSAFSAALKSAIGACHGEGYDEESDEG